jgi:hypothetical protein
MDLDPLTFPTINLPAIWTPAPENADDNPPALQIMEKARGRLLMTADILESILRQLLGETEVERVSAPPEGYDSDLQGDWDETVPTFAFQRRISLWEEERSEDVLSVRLSVDGKDSYRAEVTKNGLAITRIEDN